MDIDRTLGTVPAFFLRLGIVFGGIFITGYFLDWIGLNTKHYIFLFFPAIVLSAAILPAVRFLKRWHVPKSLAIALIYAALVAVLLGVAMLLNSLVSAEVKLLVERAPTFTPKIMEVADHLTQLAADYNINIDLQPGAGFFKESIAPHIQDALKGASHELKHIVEATLHLLMALLLVLLFGFFFTEDETFLQQASVSGVKGPEGMETASRIFNRIMDKIGRGMRAQLVIATVFGICFGLTLKAIGVNFWLSIGAAAVVLEMIPFVGGLTAIVLSVLVTLTQFDHPLVPLLLVVAAYLIITLSTHKFLSPRLMESFTGVHKVVVLVFLVIGAETWGIMGALLAVPAAIVATVLFQEWQSNRASRKERVSSILGPSGIPVKVVGGSVILTPSDKAR